ncbi:ATP-binding sensor histidine kinase [Calothrix sp. 336/3]|uniref:ATP-binding sensor histidine kinase n=1 Tax=Calothrix sp. 336/3 TaxID=1337936 RepID=UPI0004E416BF|nr:ATP-binding sensor histidine kinase [Calothrix sp. 336/3]AKG22074.1 histidine kinase [Calothrix sp. 336/3]
MVTTLVSIPGYQVSEQIYDGSRTQVYRCIRETDSLPVVIKLLKNPYPSLSELVKFRNQYTIAKNIQHPGIIQSYSLEPYHNGYMLVMEDFGGITIKDYLNSLATQNINLLQEFLQILISLCDVLEILYRQRIIHKDIKPSNILINPKTKQVKLIDFSIASLLPRESQAFISANVLEGTLAYISPEQTGRMNRAIDYRTDFYSLGVTCYELLTGELPFPSKEAMELVHCHIAKIPPTLGNRTEIPPVLDSIIQKLMAKNAEDRYQSAVGLKYDLEECLSQIQAKGNIADFEIGKRDICDRFAIPEKLYGRENEVQELLAAFERVSLGNSEIMLVAGFSGIGKTAVVNEIHKPIVRQRGYFLKGKFDQFNRNIPFSAFVQAFRELMGQLLTESDIKIQGWKRKILQALGDDGRVIIEVIPELERIIGIQAPVTELSGSAAQNRFNLLFQRFVKLFTTKEHPLVIFLDDLQWADSASLKLIQLLVSDVKQGYLLLIGAYRDNEVSPTHPLILTLDEIREAKIIVNTLTLKPLSQLKLNQLVVDTLKCAEGLAFSLSQLIYQKTQGNPFFVNQFLKSLHQDGIIEFNWLEKCWQCDICKIHQQALTDNVVEFMVFQLRKLPESTQEVLRLAACIGNQFDLQTLAIVCQLSEVEVAADLWKALQLDLILPESEIYKFYQEEDKEELFVINDKSPVLAKYKFLHDRIQQAAYCLIPEEQKQVTHLRIGQLLLQNTNEVQQGERIFEIVNQLNYGKSLIFDIPQRRHYAQLNLKAGRKAKASTAYSTAMIYLNHGIDYLTASGWETDTFLMHSLYEEAAEVALLNCDFERMESLIQVVLRQSSSVLEQVKVYEVKLQAYQVQNQQLQAIKIGREILQKLEVILPESATHLEIQQQVENTLEKCQSLTSEDLINLPLMQDTKALAALQIITSLVPSIHQAAPYLFPIIACEEVKLSLKYGNSPLSAPGYADFGIVVSIVLNKLEEGYKFGQLALRMMDKFSDKSVQSMVQFKVAAFNQSNQQSIQQAIALLKESYRVGLETGDSVHTLVSTSFRLLYTYLSGTENLESLLEEVEIYQSRFAASKHFLTWAHIISYSIKNFIDLRENPNCLGYDIDEEEQSLSALIKENDELALYLFYLCKLILNYYFGYFSFALQKADWAEKYLKAGVGMPVAPIYYYYDSLIRLSVFPTVAFSQQEQFLLRVQENQEKLQFYAQAAPMNYQHKYHLVEAVRYQILGKKLEAIDCYERAIAGAKENGYIQEEALANELAAKFYLDWGKEKIAQIYMIEAYYCYFRWGAKAKIMDLQTNYPQLLQSILQQPKSSFHVLETQNTLHTDSIHSYTQTSNSLCDVLDMMSVIQAAQVLSSNIQLDELLQQLTQIILKNSGGEKCVLVLPQDDIWQVRAITTLEDTILCTEPLDDHPCVPNKLIQYVKRTQEVVKIDDLKTDLPVIDDYLSQQKPKSILCLPILNQGHLAGIIYLKNRSTSGVFTSDRIHILNLLCAQAAISLENARLYENSQKFAQQQTQFLAKLQANEIRFQNLANNIPGMVYQFCLAPDGSTSTPYLSSGCFDLYGLAPETVMSGEHNLYALHHPEDEPAIAQAIAYSAQTLTPFKEEWRIILPSGIIKWVQSAARPERQADGSILWDGVVIDISDRKAAEALIMKKSQELEQTLTELQDTQLQMVQHEKMSALGNLVAGVAHEMNNPLGFISATLKQAKPTLGDITQHLQLYQESVENPGEEILEHAEEIDLDYSLEDLPKMFDAMVIACDRLKNISTSLRTFSRADKDYKVAFNIHEGIDSTILILKHRLKANELRPAIEVITEYGNLPHIQCFPGQLNQVFMNILANAIDALDESNTGRSFEEIKANPNQIIIKTSIADNQVKISIADNGKGMSESVQEKIFDHLFTTKAVGKGTGLGLAIAKQIITETHGGKLSCNSMIGEGTEFSIELPMSDFA